jgi:hypothetical protein
MHPTHHLASGLYKASKTPEYIFNLKMETVMFAETEKCQDLMYLIPRSQSYTTRICYHNLPSHLAFLLMHPVIVSPPFSSLPTWYGIHSWDWVSCLLLMIRWWWLEYEGYNSNDNGEFSLSHTPKMWLLTDDLEPRRLHPYITRNWDKFHLYVLLMEATALHPGFS